MKIYLIGMPGSGKSTLGSELARNLNLLFVDLDGEIENDSGKSIGDIFKEDGESVFRQMEANLLKKLSNSTGDYVMSTGGGAPCYQKGIDVMNETGISVYLKISNQELYRRLLDEKDSRPLLRQNESLQTTIRNLLLERETFYNQAIIVLESDNISIQDIEVAISKN